MKMEAIIDLMHGISMFICTTNQIINVLKKILKSNIYYSYGTMYCYQVVQINIEMPCIKSMIASIFMTPSELMKIDGPKEKTTILKHS
jgi:hypothetical protein